MSYGVHCRVGSLEILLNNCMQTTLVHCRVGSLERRRYYLPRMLCVHCRVGRFKFFSRYIILTKEIKNHVKYAFLTRLCMF